MIGHEFGKLGVSPKYFTYLWKLTLSVSRVSRSRTESAASTLLRGTSFLLGLCNRLAVAAIVVLVLRTLFSREI